MMARNRFGLGLGIVLAVGMGIVACADDDPVDPGSDAGADSAVDAGRPDVGTAENGQDSGPPDTGVKDAGKDADADADAALPPQPGVISDLAGAGETHLSVKITWTAPPDYTGKGTVAHYDIRWSTTPITNEAEFLAATAVAAPPEPEAPGTEQSAIIDGLAIETGYYVALRAQYDNDAYGPMSNVVTVSTKARATFLVTEVAPVNTAANGGDFLELVATKGGHAGGLQVLNGLDPMHTFAPFDVQVGDRIVVHASGLPGPAGFAQEDASKDKTSSTAANASAGAYDVYAEITDLPIAAGAVSVAEQPPPGGSILQTPGLVQDLVLYADRSISGFEDPRFDQHLPFVYLGIIGDGMGYWPHVLEEAEWTSLSEPCPMWTDMVNASAADAPACGGAGAGLSDGKSIQRNGTTDTNAAADFTIAPQTRGQAN